MKNHGFLAFCFERLVCGKIMGCTNAKFSSEKIGHSSLFIEEADFKIQTVLELNTAKSKNRKNRKKSSSKKKQHEGNNKHRRSKDHRRKHSKTHNSDHSAQSKSRFDNRIAAKYTIKALIGKGTFSRVIRVEHKVTRQPYALKIFESPDGEDVFEAELSILRRVKHPNVIKLVEVFESNRKVYMVMELATGGSLLDRLEAKGCLSEDDSRSVILMVLKGVQYLHSLGITHRDLKPDNLLYYHPGNDSRIMISDFGLACTRKASGNEYMHTICGTNQYIAPEIVSRKPYTCAVDMWALGVISYVTLSGRFPFDADRDAQIFKLILKGKVNFIDAIWKQFSTEAKLFVLQLLQTDPSRRLTATQAVQHDWLMAGRLTYSSSSSRKSSPDQDQSQRSIQSVGSSTSGSLNSLRSGHRRVRKYQLEALYSNLEISALM